MERVVFSWMRERERENLSLLTKHVTFSRKNLTYIKCIFFKIVM